MKKYFLLKWEYGNRLVIWQTKRESFHLSYGSDTIPFFHDSPGKQKAKDGAGKMRWCVMQSLKYKKWILAVMNPDFTEYEVTDVMSDYVEKIIQYADYLNTGKGETAIEKPVLGKLEQLKLQYEKKIW